MSDANVVEEGQKSFLQPARKQGRKFCNPVPTKVGGPDMFFKVLPRLLRNRKGRSPRETVGPFRTETSVYATEPASGLRVTWFGHSGLLLEMDGLRILIDPVWDERASPSKRLGPVRFFPPTMALAELPRLDVVLLSHDHYDHLGEQTIRQLSKLPCAAGALWVTSIGVGAVLTRFGVSGDRIVELNWTQSVAIEGSRGGTSIEITSVPSRHFSGRSLWNRFETLWGAFVISGEQHRVYFGADTGWWEGFGEIAERFGPFDLTMLEIGAFDELWHAIHLGPDRAVDAFEAMGARGLLMPIHWGLFDLALHGWRQPIERFLEVAPGRGHRVWSPEPGRPTEVVRDEGHLSRWWEKYR